MGDVSVIIIYWCEALLYYAEEHRSAGLIVAVAGRTGSSAAGDDGCAYRSGRTLAPGIHLGAPPWYRSPVLRGARVYRLSWAAAVGRRQMEGMPWLQHTRLPSSSLFPAPDVLVRVAGCGASRLDFRLLQAGRHAFGYSEASGSPLGSLVSCLVSSYSHVVGYPVEPDPPPPRGQAL